MRSDLIYDALSTVPNRYLLCQVASKATRKFHKPNTRIQETTNEVLTRFGNANGKTDRVLEPTFGDSEPLRRAA
ncbi:MAG: DNA-directed RNA polymerase subunit omega [Acidobacteriales bacterium]|nr:DNA-directed RNA polymerase subunit omega [Terriglobales bacterium]